jgi:hypothetical protein
MTPIDKVAKDMTEAAAKIHEDSHEDKLDLDNIVNQVDWDSLSELHMDTLVDIRNQLALVEELESKNESKVIGEIKDAFTGLKLCLKDLIREVIKVGLSHATVTTTEKTSAEEELEFATEFKKGVISDEDGALEYINIASQYINIQDKTINIISLGWVDLFTKLKLPTEELDATLASASEEAMEIQNAE